jgi:O-antigen/teichoic acid export membrane protein
VFPAALNSLLSRPSVQAAVRNFGWMAVERAGRLVLGMLVGFWLARYLGPERFGTWGFCLALVVLAGFLPALGLDGVVKRDVLMHAETAPRVLSSALALRLLAGALGFFAMLLVAFFGWGIAPAERPVLAILAFLLFQPAFLVPELWLQARLDARGIAGVQLGALAVCSMIRVALILAEAPLWIFAWVLVGEMTLAGIGLAFLAARRGVRLSPRDIDRSIVARLLRESWPLMLAGLAVNVYMRIDEVMLRYMLGPEAVGIYSAATRLSEACYFIPIALASSLLPALIRSRAAAPASYRARLQQYYDINAAIAYLVSLPMAVLAPWVVRWAYGEQYVESGPILSVHIWASLFVFLGVARGQWLVNEKLQLFYFVATLAGAALNIGLNLIFIPKWAGLGAAWATVISYASAAWLASFFHPAVRETAAMQTKAILVPILGWRYLRRP